MNEKTIEIVVPEKISWEESLRQETTIMAYLDVANMIGWNKRLKRGISFPKLIKTLYRDLKVKEVKAYYGTNDRKLASSEAFNRDLMKSGAILRTKPVKYLRKTIDSSMFFKRTTLNCLDQGTTTLVESVVNAVQSAGTVIEEPKCNFDVEMTMDMLDDTNRASGFILFSGDSDFHAPLERLKLKGKRIYVVGVRGMISRELSAIADYSINIGNFIQMYNAQKAKIPPEAGPRES